MKTKCFVERFGQFAVIAAGRNNKLVGDYEAVVMNLLESGEPKITQPETLKNYGVSEALFPYISRLLGSEAPADIAADVPIREKSGRYTKPSKQGDYSKNPQEPNNVSFWEGVIRRIEELHSDERL